MARVLIVDRDVDVREVLRMLLEDAGYEVLEAPDAANAFALLRAASDGMVVLFDVPGAGHDDAFFFRVAAEGSLAARHAYVCLTTSVPGLAPALRRLLVAWRVPVLAKPFDLDVLLGAVARMEERRAGARAVGASAGAARRSTA